MLEYVSVSPVQFCIINKVDRIARNRLDDAVIHATLRGRNIQLVSVTENIDESPSGMLMHGILATIAEFYSLNLAQEVVKGLKQKAIMGGTPGLAPLGYLNIRTTSGGAEIREVTTDPDRFHLVKFAFDSYATGDWTLSQLAEELNRRGLTTRESPKRPARPITTTALHKILTNPYYKGLVTFQGAVHEGTHTVMVTAEAWLALQQILARNNQTGQRPQKHDHYLKGILYCSCGAKLMFERPCGNTGERYDYFTCSGRRRGTTTCTRAAILTERIERKIEDSYTTKSLTSAQATDISNILTEVFDRLEGSDKDERAALTAQRTKLESEQLKLVQAHYADAIPVTLLKSEQTRIQNGLTAIQTRLDGLHTRYADARAGLAALLQILTDLHGLYLRCEPPERRILNQALFTKIVVDEDENVTFDTKEAVSAVISQKNTTQIARYTEDENSPGMHEGQVSTFDLPVDLRGFEPLTPCMPCRCATSCATDPRSQANAHLTTVLVYNNPPGKMKSSGLLGNPGRVAHHGIHPIDAGSYPNRFRNRKSGAIRPEAFQLVDAALLLVKDMHNHVTKVQQHPACRTAPLTAQTLHARFKETILNFVRNGKHVPLRRTAHQKKHIGKRKQRRNIKREQLTPARLMSGKRSHTQRTHSISRSRHSHPHQTQVTSQTSPQSSHIQPYPQWQSTSPPPLR